MRKLLVLLMLPALVFADDWRTRAVTASVVEDSMCIPALDGQGFLHVDEDVVGLVIKVIGDDGTTLATYDAATEIEDIAVIGTYATPSTNNVRVSPQANGGADCTQMMFDNAVYSGQKWVTITVSDGQTTIMDFRRIVYIDQGF